MATTTSTAKPAASGAASSFPILDLPVEIRRMIWRHAVYEYIIPLSGVYLVKAPALLLTNRQINAEVLDTLAQFKVLALESHGGMIVVGSVTRPEIRTRHLRALLCRFHLDQETAIARYTHQFTYGLMIELARTRHLTITIMGSDHFEDYVKDITAIVQAILRREGEVDIRVKLGAWRTFRDLSIFWTGREERLRVEIHLMRSADGRVCVTNPKEQHGSSMVVEGLSFDSLLDKIRKKLEDPESLLP